MPPPTLTSGSSAGRSVPSSTAPKTSPLLPVTTSQHKPPSKSEDRKSKITGNPRESENLDCNGLSPNEKWVGLSIVIGKEGAEFEVPNLLECSVGDRFALLYSGSPTEKSDFVRISVHSKLKNPLRGEPVAIAELLKTTKVKDIRSLHQYLSSNDVKGMTEAEVLNKFAFLNSESKKAAKTSDRDPTLLIVKLTAIRCTDNASLFQSTKEWVRNYGPYGYIRGLAEAQCTTLKRLFSTGKTLRVGVSTAASSAPPPKSVPKSVPKQRLTSRSSF